jgi:hypothetical protein
VIDGKTADNMREEIVKFRDVLPPRPLYNPHKGVLDDVLVFLPAGAPGN